MLCYTTVSSLESLKIFSSKFLVLDLLAPDLGWLDFLFLAQYGLRWNDMMCSVVLDETETKRRIADAVQAKQVLAIYNPVGFDITYSLLFCMYEYLSVFECCG